MLNIVWAGCPWSFSGKKCGQAASSLPLAWKSVDYFIIYSSVADPNPNPDPSDPYVFGPPGSGSSSQRHSSCSGSFFHQAKKIRKTLIPTVVLLLFGFLSSRKDVNVPSKSNEQKTFLKISFLLASWRSMTKIGGSRSTLECQGSATLS